MRIRNISIHGLFETFDHEIPLFDREPVTIIHGPNGVGKTSILKLVYGALKPSIRLLRAVPYSDLGLHFSDGSALHVQPTAVRLEGDAIHLRREVRKGRARRGVLFRLMRNGRVEEEYSYTGARHGAGPFPRLEAFLPMLRRLGPDEWSDRSSGAILSFEDVIRIYGPHLPEELRAGDAPDWLKHIRQATPVHFIETQRLLVRESEVERTDRERGAPESTVRQCASELARRINETLAESATISQTLERSFPTRLIAGTETGPVTMTEDEIRSKLAALDQKRSRLVEAGLLDKSNEPTLPTKRFNDTTQRVLAVYIADTEKKLQVFDDMLSRIELMRSIVNSRFLQKTLTTNRSEGFVARTRDGRPLELTGLSSGEQHELVLLYELLFKAEPNTLIMIDEPELSLHIAWQQQFLRDLLGIMKVARLTALIATHSPQIIHDRWDLTVELLGPTR